MPLDLTPFRASLDALATTVAHTEDETVMAQFDEPTQETFRVGAIKQFEITFQLSWSNIQRWLNTNIRPDIADGVTIRQLFRLAAENRLIHDVDGWMEYHEARNKAARIYDGPTADSVYRASVEFVHDARRLLKELEAQNG
jgi:nucleotidyltransferase substrate binding protein (TIGR01987 family)